jgi:hypothetical protein
MKKYIEWEKLSNVAYTCNHCKEARFQFATCTSQKICPIWNDLKDAPMEIDDDRLDDLHKKMVRIKRQLK